MDYENIIKYLQNKASDREKEQILDWIDESIENKEEFISIKKAWAFSKTANENVDSTWNSVILPEINRIKRNTSLVSYLQRAAVVIILIGLGAMSQYFIGKSKSSVYHSNFYVEAPLGQMTNVTLPDGTLVMLNSGSSLSYNKSFSEGERRVDLSGEAFFNVKKDKEYPFTVSTNLLDIKVYGTSFNVQSYPEDKNINVTLVEGSIGVMNKDGKEITRLKPGENAFMHESGGRVHISHVNTGIYTSWRNGLATFRGEKLEDLAQKIERWYNVEIIILNKELGEGRYFGTILKNKPIDQILEVLKLTTSLEYEIINRPGKPTLIYWK